MRVVDHHSEQVLQQLAVREPRADRAKRLRTVLLAAADIAGVQVRLSKVCARHGRRGSQHGKIL